MKIFNRWIFSRIVVPADKECYHSMLFSDKDIEKYDKAVQERGQIGDIEGMNAILKAKDILINVTCEQNKSVKEQMMRDINLFYANKELNKLTCDTYKENEK